MEKYKITSLEELQVSSLDVGFKKRVDKLVSRISGEEAIQGASCFEQVAHDLTTSEYQDSNVVFLSFPNLPSPPHHVVLTDRSNTHILFDPPETLNYQGDDMEGFYLDAQNLLGEELMTYQIKKWILQDDILRATYKKIQGDTELKSSDLSAFEKALADHVTKANEYGKNWAERKHNIAQNETIEWFKNLSVDELRRTFLT